MRKGVQLITYPDSLGGNLKSLHAVLENNFRGLFDGVHILPFYPSSGDRGFAPLTYFKVAPDFGSWEDISDLGSSHDVLADVMVNHISARSEYFQDFLMHGRKSKYANYFITLEKFWEDGIPVESDVEKIFLRREKPYSDYIVAATGKKETVWTTFGKENPSEQVDLDINSDEVRQMFVDVFRHFSEQNINIVRLDAVGYVAKKIDTSCFFVDPDVYDFLDWVRSIAEPLNIELLPEVHSHYSIQYKLSEKGYWIYDFILPYRILEALLTSKSEALTEYLKIRPLKQFTMLDCHDGIPVKPDLDGLVKSTDARHIVDICLSRGANLSKIVSDEHKGACGFDVHQIRGTYYSMLDCDDDAYIAARALQLFTPGIPQVYYTGLLAGENDNVRVAETGEGREINRHNYCMEEIEQSLRKPVVQRLLALIKFRNQYDVFDGDFQVSGTKDTISLCWNKGSLKASLDVDLKEKETVIRYIKDGLGNSFVA
ncbi:MAG: sucrose phosphorylase [Oscillospiraceae bacterium]|nr:sucrose phosphorylase [Oscillospiraceae bacterium]MCL2279426.1 sucrose phosphorylase [Oscillospiraceae bacterium]